MTGLIASPAAPPDPAGASVVADGWFPPIQLASVRDRLRLGAGAIPTPLLTEAIEGAMLHAFRELASWRSDRASEGAESLADVTDLTINGQNRAVVLWERVVRYFAAADLFAENRDISATDQGLDRAAEKESTSDEYRRNALAAVADLRSIGAATPVPRNRVSLL
ncbi:head completion/stabilization protein [Sphingomonas sp.]|uniref:head completion/stabilization protein n=1 Tax=Sphingomonas sp. TaxID=28214 RepID=UPI003F7170CE